MSPKIAICMSICRCAFSAACACTCVVQALQHRIYINILRRLLNSHPTVNTISYISFGSASVELGSATNPIFLARRTPHCCRSQSKFISINATVVTYRRLPYNPPSTMYPVCHCHTQRNCFWNINT